MPAHDRSSPKKTDDDRPETTRRTPDDPGGLLALHRLGVINGNTLTKHWRYATVIIAVIAAAMPGADPVTTGLEALPLVVLFLLSIVLLKIADRRAAARAAKESTQQYDSGLGIPS